jgi:hypothetical protein
MTIAARAIREAGGCGHSKDNHTDCAIRDHCICAIEADAVIAALDAALPAPVAEAVLQGLTRDLRSAESVADAWKRQAERLRGFIDNPPKHRFWGAGEPDCPRDIKAGNGELHTLRCKACGLENPRNDICRAALDAAPPAPVAEAVVDPAPDDWTPVVQMHDNLDSTQTCKVCCYTSPDAAAIGRAGRDAMTDIAELCARLRAPLFYVGISRGFADLIEAARDAAPALESLTARVAELEAENTYLVGKLDCKAALIDGLRQTVGEERARADAAFNEGVEAVAEWLDCIVAPINADFVRRALKRPAPSDGVAT